MGQSSPLHGLRYLAETVRVMKMNKPLANRGGPEFRLGRLFYAALVRELSGQRVTRLGRRASPPRTMTLWGIPTAMDDTLPPDACTLSSLSRLGAIIQDLEGT